MRTQAARCCAWYGLSSCAELRVWGQIGVLASLEMCLPFHPGLEHDRGREQRVEMQDKPLRAAMAEGERRWES